MLSFFDRVQQHTVYAVFRQYKNGDKYVSCQLWGRPIEWSILSFESCVIGIYLATEVDAEIRHKYRASTVL